MNRSKWVCFALMDGGILMLILAFLVPSGGSPHPALVGIGVTLLAVGFLRILNLWQEKSSPETARREAIELADERNTRIREKADAQAGDICAWLSLILAYVALLFDLPLWAVLAATGVFAAHGFLKLWLYARIEKQM